ncbi:MAG TPA: hypothetical protein VFV10_21180 [Gammaproteobacteria bacterium]|nr:hypothetical protein [Gammaproteobacteria bacterium]
MIRRVTRIAPWQAAKIFALMYFVIGIVIAIPMYFFVEATRALTGAAGPGFGIGFVIVMPVLYAVGALIFVPLGCLLYNLAAKITGGLELDVIEKAA